MEEPIRYRPATEAPDDEDRDLMDSRNWDWEHPVEVDIAEDPRLSFAISLTIEEHHLLAEAARAGRLTTPAFIKRAALQAARNGTAAAEMTDGTPRTATA